MDPLSIAACAITLGEVVVKTSRIFALIKDLSSVPERTSELVQDIDNLRIVEMAVRAFLSAEHANEMRVAIFAILGECNQLLGSLESLLLPCLELQQRGAVIRSRAVWMSKSRRIDRLRERLGVATASLSLCLTVTSAARLFTYQIEQPNSPLTLGSLQNPLVVPDERTPLTSLPIRPNLVGLGITIDRSSNSAEGYHHQRETPLANPRPQVPCRCICHNNRKRWFLIHKELGFVYVSFNSSMLGTGSCQFCVSSSCGSSNSIQVACFGPRWLSRSGLRLAITTSPRMQVLVAFPRIISPDEDFCVQIRNGNHSRVRELLVNGKGSISDTITPFGISPLMLSILYGQSQVAQVLLASGAKLTCDYDWPLSEFFDFVRRYSLSHCSISTFSVMSDNGRQMGALWHLQDLGICCESLTAVSSSASRLQKSIVGISMEDPLRIISEGDDEIHDTDNFGRSTLHLAVLTNQARLLRKLLSVGVDPHVRDSDGAAPLHLAAGMGLQDCVTILLEAGSSPLIQDRWGTMPIHWAAYQGRTEILQLFIDRGLSVDTASALGETPLLYAIHARSLEAVDLLVNLGASAVTKDLWGYTPVTDACFSQATNELRQLLNRNFDYQQPLNDGKSLLHIAARTADSRIIDLLLQSDLSGLNPDAFDDDGMSPIQYLRQRPNYRSFEGQFTALLSSIRKANEQRPALLDDLEDAEQDVFHDASEFWLELPQEGGDEKETVTFIGTKEIGRS